MKFTAHKTQNSAFLSLHVCSIPYCVPSWACFAGAKSRATQVTLVFVNLKSKTRSNFFFRRNFPVIPTF